MVVIQTIHKVHIIKSTHFIPPAYEDGTDRVFQNVGIYNSDAGETPKRKHNI